MSISNEEKEYLQSLVDAMGEVRIRYKESDNSEEKRQIKVQYENFSRLYNDFLNKLLEEDIEFTQADVDAVKDIGKRISRAATFQQLIIAIAELAAKYAI
jgi:acetate kinase